MLFNSFPFIFAFLPAALAGYFVFGLLHHRAATAWLVIASLAFYAFWNAVYLPLLIASFLFNFLVGEALSASAQRPRLQTLILILGISSDLGVLFYYKYFSSLLSFASQFGLHHQSVPELLLPLGISFFTFTQIGYLVDVQQGVARQRGLLNFLVFVTFFPHLIAGPVLHNQEIMPQFADKRVARVSMENLVVGLMLFVLGLAKKCLLADPIASTVAAGFSDPAHTTLFSSWLLMLTYSLHLYFDFSGYTDMAIGIARMFNIRFPVNFNSPFKATSIIDYWQRWHITLTRFLTLYLFNPLALAAARRHARRNTADGQARAKTASHFAHMVAFPILLTMGLAGIWHGAGLQYLVFGLLHGCFLTINHAWRTIRGPRKQNSSRLVHCGNLTLTLACVLVALVFFRAPSLGSAATLLAAMAGTHGIAPLPLPGSVLHQFGNLGTAIQHLGLTTPLPMTDFAEQSVQIGWIAVLCLVVWVLPNSQQLLSSYAPVLGRINPSHSRLLVWRPTTGWAVALGALAAISMVAFGGTAEFLYFQF